MGAASGRARHAHGQAGAAASGPAGWQSVAGTGAAVTLGSMFLPWYVVHLRDHRVCQPVGFRDAARREHATGLRAARRGVVLRIGQSVGALAAGVWDWRALIAVGAASVLLLLAFRVMNRSRPAGRLPH